MGVFVTPQIEIDSYYASEALGQSKGKQILRSLSDFTAPREDIDSKPYIILGKGVDTLLTGVEGEFEKTYHISQVEKLPSETVIGIIGQVFDKVRDNYNNYLLTVPVTEAVEIVDKGDYVVAQNDSLEQESCAEIVPFSLFVKPLHLYEEFILEACANVNYQPRWGVDAKLKAIVEPSYEYFNDLCKAEGKKVISGDIYNTITNVVNSLKSHPRTSRYFDRDFQAEQTVVDFYYQLPIYFRYNEVDCKALLDLVVVIKDINGDILKVEPIDLKTMSGDTFDFPNSIKSHRYDIQAAYYTEAVYAYFSLDRENEDIVSPFKFIVESTTRQGKPLIFEMTADYLALAREGHQQSANYYVPGVNDILRKVNYHIENGWELEQEIQEADEAMRFLQVGPFGIIK